MKKIVTWNDLHNATHQELKSKYKLTDRALENQVQKHLDGANAAEKRALYSKVWDKRK